MPECSVGSDSNPFLNLRGEEKKKSKKCVSRNPRHLWGNCTQLRAFLSCFKMGKNKQLDILSWGPNNKKFHLFNDQSVLLRREVWTLLEARAKFWLGTANNGQMGARLSKQHLPSRSVRDFNCNFQMKTIRSLVLLGKTQWAHVRFHALT